MKKEIRTETVIEASREKVWEILTAFEKYPEWNPFIKQLNGELRVGTRLSVTMHAPGMKPMLFKPTVKTSVDKTSFSWLGHLLIPGLFDGRHCFELIDEGGGKTRLVQSEEFSGILIPLLRKVIEVNTVQGFAAMNRALKERAEQT